MPIGSLLKMQFPWPFNLQDPIFKSVSKEFRILNEIPEWFSYKTSVRDWIVYPPNSFIEIFTPKWQPTPVFLSGESHGQRSLAGYSPWGSKNRTRLSD